MKTNKIYKYFQFKWPFSHKDENAPIFFSTRPSISDIAVEISSLRFDRTERIIKAIAWLAFTRKLGTISSHNLKVKPAWCARNKLLLWMRTENQKKANYDFLISKKLLILESIALLPAVKGIKFPASDSCLGIFIKARYKLKKLVYIIISSGYLSMWSFNNRTASIIDWLQIK